MSAASSRTDDRSGNLAREVRIHLFRVAAETGRVPQAPAIARALGRSEAEVLGALWALAESRALILAPNGTEIWSANPFCAVPSAFRVEVPGRLYRGICIWDALGILAALGEDGVVRTPCGDCGDPMRLEVHGGELAGAEGLVHFGVPAARWWDNIGYT